MKYSIQNYLIIIELSLIWRSCVASEYALLFDDNDFFQKCENHPGNGIKDFADLSELKIEVNEYNLHLKGPLKFIWDVETTDRIQVFCGFNIKIILK